MTDSHHSRFRYEKIADYISDAIDNGTIPLGSKLPSLRKMSSRFNCAVSVVMQAYEELEKQGKTYAVEKSGFFASTPSNNPLPDMQHEYYSLKPEYAAPLSMIGKIVEASNDKSILPFGAGVPHESLLPIAGLKQSINRVLRDKSSLLQKYTNEAGDICLRKEICKIMLSRGVKANPEEILITNGCIEALSFSIQVATSEGDSIAIESPVFMGAIQLIKELNRKIIPIPTSAEEGMDLDVLESVLRKKKIKAVLMTAAFQNPLGFIMPEDKRIRAVALTAKYGVPVIEDDLYSDCSHRFTIERPLKSFDKHSNVIYCSSFSKTISPGLRIGWLMGGNYHRECRNIKITQTLGGSYLLQRAAADFLQHGRYENHVKKLQKSISRQAVELKQLLSGSLPERTAISSPRGGYFFWIELPEEIDTLDLFDKALKEKISIVPGKVFSSGERFANCLRLSFASPVTDKTREGIKKLGSIINNSTG